MEWTKYVLALTVGVCLLILFGRKRTEETSGCWEAEQASVWRQWN